MHEKGDGEVENNIHDRSYSFIQMTGTLTKPIKGEIDMNEKTELFRQYLNDPDAERYLEFSLIKFLKTSFTRTGRTRLLFEITEGCLSDNEKNLELYEICKRFPNRVFAALDETSRKQVAKIADKQHFEMRILSKAGLFFIILYPVYYVIKMFLT